MIGFLFRLIVFAAFLGAIAWFLPPVLKEYSPSVYDKIATIALGRDVRTLPENVEEDMPEGLSEEEYEKEMVRRLAERDAAKKAKIEQRMAAKREAAKAKLAAAVPVKRVVVVQETEEDLGPDLRAATNEEPPYPWGLVVTNSMCYDEELAEVAFVDGGTVVARMQDRPTRKGLFVETKILKNNEWKPRTVLFHDSDLVYFDGVRYSETNRRQRDVLIDFCTAYGKAEALRAKLVERTMASVAYPDEMAWRQAKADWDNFQAKSDALRKDIESTNPSVRGRALDQARLLKHDEAKLKRAWDAADKAKAEWLRDNAPNLGGLLDNPMLAPHVETLRRLAPQAEQIVPGITPLWMR